MSRVKYWVWFSQLYQVRPKSKARLLEEFSSPEEIFFADRVLFEAVEWLNDRERELLCDKRLENTMAILERCADQGIELLCLADADYPARLANIYDPPCVLYVRGRLPWLDEEAAVAVVGTRGATPYGVKMGRRMGYEICSYGGVVVSGLARGVDTAAAEGALRAGGLCIGVLGTGIDVVYPRENRRLFEDVAATGAILSEYPPGAPVNRMNFPRRNRILSGVSAGVVVIEAPEKSGALITADLASEQGRDLFVVPGNADSASCVGSNRLIQEGAKPVMNGWDVMGDYVSRFPGKVRYEAGLPRPEYPEPPTQPDAPEKSGIYKYRIPRRQKEIDKEKHIEYIDLKEQLASLSERQLRLISAMERPGMQVDEIIEKIGLSAREALSELTVLQIKGIVYQQAGKRFSLSVKRTK